VQIFKVKSGLNFNPEDPNYDLFKLAIETSANRLFPNFSFIDAPFNLQYYTPGDYNTEIAYMGCRTRVIGNVHDPERQIISGRGNLSFTSINLPRLGIEARGNINKFYAMLDEQIDLVIRQLLHRLKIQSGKKVRNYPFLMGNGVWIDSEKLKIDDTIEGVLKHGTLSMGFIGLAETLKALVGVHHGENEEAQKLGLEIVGHMRKMMDDECAGRKLNFSLLATPAESLSGRFVSIDSKKYGVLPGITDRDYYTNSFHVPVYFPIKAFKKIQIEAPYHALTNAGHITYVEMDGDMSKNLEAFEVIIRYMHSQGVGYGSVNHPLDRDPVCGYRGIIHDVCPRCGRKVGEGLTEKKYKALQKQYMDVPRKKC
jgi:ribonucleoside-triphosphate reductase